MLPSEKVLISQVQRAGLEVADFFELGESYSQTLRKWHVSFNHMWDQAKGLGFDDRFKRMWDFYLTSCAGALKVKIATWFKSL